MTRDGRWYVACQIWLSRNSLTFEAEVVFAHHVMKRAYSLAGKYSRFDCIDTIGQLTIISGSWDSLAAPTVIRRILFIS